MLVSWSISVTAITAEDLAPLFEALVAGEHAFWKMALALRADRSGPDDGGGFLARLAYRVRAQVAVPGVEEEEDLFKPPVCPRG